MMNYALKLAESGLCVLPLRPRQKTPMVANWQNLATTDEKQIREWWTAWPDANIGIACGLSGLTVVDVDAKNGNDGLDVWNALCIKHRIADETVTAHTPSGGLHLYYRTPENVDLHNTAGRLGVGIDTRSNGGYVVAPPSVTDVGAYRWDKQQHNFLTLPDVLIDLLKEPEKAPFVLGEKIEQGERNVNMFKFACKLRADGMEFDEILAALKSTNQKRCVPPQTDGELLAIATSACRYEKGDRKQAEYHKNVQSAEYIAILAQLGYTFRMNALDDRVEVTSEPISDALESKIKTQLRDIGYPQVNVARDAYIAEAYDHQYHPIKDYLENLQWNGQDHIGNLGCYFRDSQGAFGALLKLWLIGAVAKVYAAEQNRMLCLDGPQGIGKSHFVRWLCPEHLRLEHYIDSRINPDDKDGFVRLVSVWIWEVGELGVTTRKADIESLKQFLSMRQVTVRQAYARYDLDKPALASFIGTVNNIDGFLADPSGHRRFMSIKLDSIDWNYATEIDVNQVWSQAKALYDAGEHWQPEGNELTLVDSLNAEYQIDDPVEDYFNVTIETTNNPQDFMSTNDILYRLHTAGYNDRNPTVERRALSSFAIKAGLEKMTARIDGVQQRGYIGIRKRDKNG